MVLPTLTARLSQAARLARTRLLDPAFVATVAYVDPGDVAANTAAGVTYQSLLLSVLVGAICPSPWSARLLGAALHLHR